CIPASLPLACLYFVALRPRPLPPSPTFSFKATATTEIYTLSLHDALPISRDEVSQITDSATRVARVRDELFAGDGVTQGSSRTRSEEHTSELQSRENLVCRLLLEKKKKTSNPTTTGSAEDNNTHSTTASNT